MVHLKISLRIRTRAITHANTTQTGPALAAMDPNSTAKPRPEDVDVTCPLSVSTGTTPSTAETTHPLTAGLPPSASSSSGNAASSSLGFPTTPPIDILFLSMHGSSPDQFIAALRSGRSIQPGVVPATPIWGGVGVS